MSYLFAYHIHIFTVFFQLSVTCNVLRIPLNFTQPTSLVAHCYANKNWKHFFEIRDQTAPAIRRPCVRHMAH